MLPDAVIEHIGSSSIPNAISKGDLDILVGINASELEKAVTRLTTLGSQMTIVEKNQFL
ncbi:hypothetical protein VIAQ111709_07315 [Vibrio aquimaris]|uniref:Uncharacterized protein n=1 Tax=Vibrio aquimaris TaxID=2587862 RepID=A0A5P9CJC9_9VIBR|nr:hypothetical protein FIV01_07830 [Vibrio aquimaris]